MSAPRENVDTPQGLAFAVTAYVLWGFLPLYMKLLSHVPPSEVVVHRIVWSVIAGSIGPLAASYRPDIHPPHDEATPLYAEVARLLAPRVDLIICETVASLAHARSALEGALSSGKEVWLAVTVDDEDGSLLRSGEKVADVVPLIDGASALLANCSAPEAMPAAIEQMLKSGLPVGAYGNGFTQITKDFLKDDPPSSVWICDRA